MLVRDVWMVQRHEHLPFATIAGEAFWIVSDFRQERLERNVAIQFDVAGTVDLAHTASSEGREDFVRVEADTDGEGQRSRWIMWTGRSPTVQRRCPLNSGNSTPPGEY